MSPTIAAGMVAAPTHGRLLEAAIPACSASDGNAAAVGPSSAGGACGRDAQASPAVPCRLCAASAVPGDDLALCRSHGGLGPEWADFDEAAWLAGREAC